MRIFFRLFIALAALTFLLSGCFHSKLFKKSSSPAPAPAETSFPASSEDAVESVRAKLKAAGFQVADYEHALNLAVPGNVVKSWKFQVRSKDSNIDVGIIVAKNDAAAVFIEGDLESQLDEVKKADSDFMGEFFDIGRDDIIVTLSYYPKDVDEADVAKLKAALK